MSGRCMVCMERRSDGDSSSDEHFKVIIVSFRQKHAVNASPLSDAILVNNNHSSLFPFGSKISRASPKVAFWRRPFFVLNAT